jgi:hypothetical protein
MLKDMRQQFLQLLNDIGFVPKGSSTGVKASWNQNAANVPVLKAVLCAGLYGNVAVMDPSSGVCTNDAAGHSASAAGGG